MATLLSRGSGKGSGPIYKRPNPRSSESSACQTCHNWGLEMLGSQGDAPRLKVDFYDIAELADLEECCYCYAIYHTIMALDGRINLDGYHILTLSAEKSKPFYVSWDDTADGRVCAEVYRRRDELESPGLLDGLGSADAIEPDASSDALFSKARQWLDDCSTTHPACQQGAIAMPKRLLFVGSAEQDSIRLIEDVLNDVKFIALSHCWGTNKFRTTQSNLCQRVRNIPWDELPKTFQDIVIVSRKLEVRYIWIDSLCIIQDDRADWASESARMGAIYGGAYLTIAAASASDDREGFLLPTQARTYYKSSEVDLFPFSNHSQVLSRRVHDVRTLKHVDPLSLRGWTFQERLLPRRLMTYTQGALTFECVTASYCECGSGLRPDPFLREIRRNIKDSEKPLHRNWFDETRREVLRDLVGYGRLDTRAAYDEWYFQIVRPFTYRKLSRATDILPSISAIAEKFQAVLGDDYLAGLWKGDLKRGLVWRRRFFSDPIAHPSYSTAEYRAPSWSWASIAGPIDHGFSANAYFTYHLKLHEVQCTRASSESAFGEISEGWLLVSGQVWTMRLDIKPSASEDGISGSKALFSDDNCGFVIDTDIFDTGIMEQVLPGSISETTIVRAPRGQKQNCVSGPVTLLLCADGNWQGYVKMYVLVLARVTAGQEVYRRIGSIYDSHVKIIEIREAEERMIKII